MHVDDVGGLEQDKEQAVSVRKVPGSGTPGKYYLRIVLADHNREFETLQLYSNAMPRVRSKPGCRCGQRLLIGDLKALGRFFTQLATHYKPVVIASYDADEADALTIHFKSTSEQKQGS